MRILIVEDAACIALPMQATLSQQGHQVDWISGVRSFEPFIGITEDKQDVKHDVPVNDASGYDLALVDGQLLGKIEGPAVVSFLSSKGVTCVAISSKHDFNADMVRNGAAVGFIKHALFAALMLDGITGEDIRQPSLQLCERINAFEQRIQDDKELRSKLDQILMSYLR